MKIKQRFRNFTKTHLQFVLFKWVYGAAIQEYIYRYICIPYIQHTAVGKELKLDRTPFWEIDQSIPKATDQMRSFSDLSATPSDPNTLHSVTAYTHKQNKLFIDMTYGITL